MPALARENYPGRSLGYSRALFFRINAGAPTSNLEFQGNWFFPPRVCDFMICGSRRVLNEIIGPEERSGGPAVLLPSITAPNKKSPPPNCHPERSASQMDRVTQHLWRGVEGPRRCLITPAVRSFSTTGPAKRTAAIWLLSDRFNCECFWANSQPSLGDQFWRG